jgi:SulP family sulfate permease
MAGVILIIMGAGKLGAMIKFIPYPVTTGFTTGIAVIIASGQIKDFFGLGIQKVPSEFVAQWGTYWQHLTSGGINWASFAIAFGSLILLGFMRVYVPRIPSYIVAVVIATAIVWLFGLDSRFGVATIESRFAGGIPPGFPRPTLPHMDLSLANIKALIPSATTIALLAGIESLLSAVVADGMIGGRHKSNCELVAQGVANIGSICFGGIPATGAIARTAANIKSGGRTPLAGMIHAAVVLVFMLFLAPLGNKIPLPVLAAVLMMVAWGMSERDHFKTLFKAPRSDIVVLLTTFGLTVFADLTIAVGVGMVLASMLFMKRMSEVTNLGPLQDELADLPEDLTGASDPNSLATRNIPPDVEVYEINGPFFFGVADRLKDTRRGWNAPKGFILRMRRVPAIDATACTRWTSSTSSANARHHAPALRRARPADVCPWPSTSCSTRSARKTSSATSTMRSARARELVGAAPQPKILKKKNKNKSPPQAVPEVTR